jgi:DNA-directed RNA polymerase specialized sigma24 family protein
VSVPQYIIDTASIIMRQSLQDHPIEEISAITGLRTNHIEWALEYLKVRAISMDKATSEDEDTNFDNYVPYHEDYSTAYVKDFIQSLKPKHREVLLLVLQHKSLREIGETFGISYQGVGNRMVFVRKYMMQYQAAANGQA